MRVLPLPSGEQRCDNRYSRTRADPKKSANWWEASMTTSRRRFLQGTAATAAIAGAPGLLRAQAAPAANRTIRAVMHGDLRAFDPIWTTANITSYHGAMIYDVLFAYDSSYKPQPQMVSKWGI